MPDYYQLEPEVAGQLGEECEMDRSVHPPDVTKLHYEFHGWQGDDLLTTVANFIVSDPVRESLTSRDLSGYTIDDVTVSKSPEFDELYPDTDLPAFYWLKITGEPGEDDFGIADNNRLVISADALSVLEDATIDQATVTEYRE